MSLWEGNAVPQDGGGLFRSVDGSTSTASTLMVTWEASRAREFLVSSAWVLCCSNQAPHAGHTWVSKLTVPQASQVRSRRRIHCHARIPTPEPIRGRSSSSRANPPAMSRRNRPAGPGRNSRRAASPSQNQGMEDRCIQRWNRGSWSIHRSNAARASMPAQPSSNVATTVMTIPPTIITRGTRVSRAMPARTTEPSAVAISRRLAGSGAILIDEKGGIEITGMGWDRFLHPGPWTADFRWGEVRMAHHGASGQGSRSDTARNKEPLQATTARASEARRHQRPHKLENAGPLQTVTVLR